MPQEGNATSEDVEKNSIIKELNKNATKRPVEEEILYSWYLIQNDADIIRNVTRLKQSDQFLLQNLALQHLPPSNRTKKKNVTHRAEKKNEVKNILPSVSDYPLLQKDVATHSSFRLNSSKFLNPYSNLSIPEINNAPSFQSNEKHNNPLKYTQDTLSNSSEDTADILISNVTSPLSKAEIRKESSIVQLDASQKYPQLSVEKSFFQTPLPRQQYEKLSENNNTIQLPYESTPINHSLKLSSLLLVPYNQSQNTQLYLLQILPEVNVSTASDIKEIKNLFLPTAHERVQINTSVVQPSVTKFSSNLSHSDSLFSRDLKKKQNSNKENLLTPVKSLNGSKLRQSTTVTKKGDYKKQYTLLVVCIVLIGGSTVLLCGFVLLKMLWKQKKPSPSLKRTKTFILCEKKKVRFSDDSTPSCTTNDTMETESDETHYPRKSNNFCETPTIHLNILSHVDTNQAIMPKDYPLSEIIPFNIKPSHFHSSNDLQSSSLFTTSRCKRPFSAIQK